MAAETKKQKIIWNLKMTTKFEFLKVAKRKAAFLIFKIQIITV